MTDTNTPADDRLLRDLELLNELFTQGGIKELRVVGPNVSVLLSTEAQSSSALSSGPVSQAPTQVAPALAKPAPAAQPASTAASSGAIDPKWAAVTAPNLGTFYRSPKPGSPAFVEVGQKVTVGTELCLIEVMKLFTSVRAEVAGTVRHIAAADAELVEGGQPLLYIEHE
jgi:acetyl-CoA carboxylase biotin carboxyl carrier protein